MSGELRYLVFAVEDYRQAKSLTGAEVAALFSENGVYQLIEDNYFLYHIESPDNMVADVDHYLATGSTLYA